MQASLGRWARRFVAAFSVAVLMGGAVYGYWVVFQHRFVAITEGRLYQSAEMPLSDLADTVQEYGIRTVVDLRKVQAKAEAERESLAALGVDYVHLPSDQIPSAEVVATFLSVMDQAETQPVLLHCEHGEGRSALLAAIYRIELEGWPADRARRATRFMPSRGSFSPGRSKGKYLLSYVSRLTLAERLLEP